MGFVLSFIKIRDQPLGRQVCLTMPFISFISLSTKYKSLDTILVERRDRVGLITLNRPKSLNALNIQLARELVQTLKDFDKGKAPQSGRLC